MVEKALWKKKNYKENMYFSRYLNVLQSYYNIWHWHRNSKYNICGTKQSAEIDPQKCHFIYLFFRSVILIQCEITGLLIHDPGITGYLSRRKQARSSTSYHMPKWIPDG